MTASITTYVDQVDGLLAREGHPRADYSTAQHHWLRGQTPAETAAIVIRHRDACRAMEAQPHIVLVANKLYGYGETLVLALDDFGRNIAGATPSWQRSMRQRARAVLLNADEASEVAEMIAAPAISWEG